MLNGEDGSGEIDARSVELGPSGRLRAVLKILAAATVVVATTIGLVLLLGRQAVPSFWFLPIQLAAGLGPLIVVSLRTTVQIDGDGVRIIGGSKLARGDWGWEDLLEVCLTRQSGAWSLAVRPRGSVWDQPGPTAPAIVLPTMKDRATRERAQRALRWWCMDRDVVFTETGMGLGSAPPGSPLRPRPTSGDDVFGEG